MKTKTTRGIILTAAMSLLMPVLAFAQSTNQNGNVTVIATVNIYNAKIVSQSSGDIKVSFDLSNRTGVQPEVKYAVQLIDKKTGALADEKIFDEILNLQENSTASKTIDYTPPAFLKGAYQIWVISKNGEGLPLGQGLAGEINLAGTASLIQINAPSCYLTVQDDQSKKYTLSQGVDVAPAEKLAINCDINNSYKTGTSAVPVFETYYRTVFGAKVATDKQAAVAFNAGEKKTMALTIAKAENPQAYDAKFFFQDASGQLVSNAVVFHYVVQGQGATIENLKLDKNTYQPGDTAKVSFYWAGSADNFPQSRSGAQDDLQNVSVEVSINDASGTACSDPVIQPVSNQEQGGLLELSAAITKNCSNPVVSADIKENGKVLAEKNFNINNATIGPVQKAASQPSNQAGQKALNIKAIAILIVILLLLISVLVIVIKKRKSGGFFGVLIVFSLAMGFAALSGRAQADTFTVHSTYCYPNGCQFGQAGCYCEFGDAIYSVSLNKSAYSPGETMTASASMNQASSCLNGYTEGRVAVAFNTTNSRLFTYDPFGAWLQQFTTSGSVNGPAENVAGNYSAVFTGYAAGANNDYLGASATDSISYSVVPPPPTLSVTKSGSGTVTSNPAGINCGAACSGIFTQGSSVTLSATADSGSTFDSWGGACSGTISPCSVTMDTNKTVNAVFKTCAAKPGVYTCVQTPSSCDSSNCGTTGSAICLNSCNTSVPLSNCGTCAPVTCPACTGSNAWKEVAP